VLFISQHRLTATYSLDGAVSYLDAFISTTKPTVFVDASQSVHERDVSATAGALVREPCVLSVQIKLNVVNK